MKEKKIKILCSMAIMFMILLAVGCSKTSHSDDNSSKSKAAVKSKWIPSNTSTNLKSKYSVTRGEFVSQGQNIIDKLKLICDKYGIKYTFNDKYSRGNWLAFNAKDIKENGNNGNVYDISYTGDIITDGKGNTTAYNNVELDVRQKNNKHFDTSSCKFLREFITSLTGKSNYDFKDFNSSVKQVDKDYTKKVLANRVKNNAKSFETIRVVQYNDNENTLEYRFVTGSMPLK
ncbi:hypothetical protein NL50_13580 [Clostridium acetobutylicum]|nr:hypothetical protein NL50_13580 [Clostridium acetobutylicum]